MFTWNLELKLNNILTDREWMDFSNFINNHPTIGGKIIELAKAKPLENRVVVTQIGGIMMIDGRKFKEEIKRRFIPSFENEILIALEQSEILSNPVEKQDGHTQKMKVVKDCTCQHDEHEVSHHYREGLKIKELKKDDIVEFVKEWHNVYGKYIRVKKDGKTYDIKPENLAVLST